MTDKQKHPAQPEDAGEDGPEAEAYSDLIPWEGNVFTAVKDAQGRISLLRGHFDEFAGLAEEDEHVLCFHESIAVDDTFQVDLMTTHHEAFYPWTKEERAFVADLVAAYAEAWDKHLADEDEGEDDEEGGDE